MTEEIAAEDVGTLPEFVEPPRVDPAAPPVEITLYDLVSGAAIYTATVDEGRQDDCCAEGQGWIAGLAERVDLDTLQPVSLLEFAPEIEVDRIGNIPAGTTAVVGIVRYPPEVIGGEITFALDYAQTKRVQLSHPLYRFEAFEVACASHI